MNTEIARQLREGIMYGKAWSFAAKSGVPLDFLESSLKRFRSENGKLPQKAFERTIRRRGIVKHLGRYWWFYSNQGRVYGEK